MLAVGDYKTMIKIKLKYRLHIYMRILPLNSVLARMPFNVKTLATE